MISEYQKVVDTLSNGFKNLFEKQNNQLTTEDYVQLSLFPFTAFLTSHLMRKLLFLNCFHFHMNFKKQMIDAVTAFVSSHRTFVTTEQLRFVFSLNIVLK